MCKKTYIITWVLKTMKVDKRWTFLCFARDKINVFYIILLPCSRVAATAAKQCFVHSVGRLGAPPTICQPGRPRNVLSLDCQYLWLSEAVINALLLLLQPLCCRKKQFKRIAHKKQPSRVRYVMKFFSVSVFTFNCEFMTKICIVFTTVAIDNLFKTTFVNNVYVSIVAIVISTPGKTNTHVI